MYRKLKRKVHETWHLSMWKNRGKGEIIFFPSNNKLTGIYNENREAFERCIYETDSYITRLLENKAGFFHMDSFHMQ